MYQKYSYLMPIFLFVIGVVITILTIPMIKNMLIRSSLVRKNYRGDFIPVGMGIAFIPAAMINGLILSFFNIEGDRISTIFIMLFGIISMCFCGILDDSLGNRDVTGLKGHFTSMFRGRLTTGGFKAVMGGFIGLIVSASITKSIPEIIVGTLVIALSTNFMNLFDLRPGRAIKVYALLSIILLIIVSPFNRQVYMLIFPAVIAYFYEDIRANSMMGDAGSNVLGVSFGIFQVISFNIRFQIVSLIILVLFHILTEKYSLTKIIEKNYILNYIDKLGRN